MAKYAIRIYEGCPIPTFLWNVVSLVAYISGFSGFLSLYYVFFPTSDTDSGFVLMGAIIGIPLFFVCLFVRKGIEKLGEKQLAKKQKEASVTQTRSETLERRMEDNE